MEDDPRLGQEQEKQLNFRSKNLRLPLLFRPLRPLLCVTQAGSGIVPPARCRTPTGKPPVNAR